MSTTDTFRVNTPTVTAESFEGEVVIINLRSGFYYSSVGTGAELWDALHAGATREAIVECAARDYVGAADSIRKSVDHFISQLLEEGLIVPGAGGGDAVDGQLKFGSEGANEFVEPELQKYEDMEQLLLLDPIHEVDEAGWPITRPADQTTKDD
jgi:hypothetical protein